MANVVEDLIRAAVKLGKEPNLTNITELLFPVVAFAQSVKDQDIEATIDTAVLGLDPCIGSEENAIIGGADNPNALVKVDIPLTDEDGATLEFGSDAVLAVASKLLKAKFVTEETDSAEVPEPPPGV